MSTSSQRRSLFGHLATATQRTLQDWLILVPLVVIIGGLGQVAASWLASETLAALGPNGVRADLRPFVHAAVDWVFWFPVGVLVYPFLDAVTIWCWREREAGRLTSAYKAFNWAALRYRRMFLPHAIAYTAVYVGGQIIVGIFFGLQYAFVDAITATDDKAQRPLLRSAKFTEGRRVRIAQAWLPYVAFNVGGGLVLLPAAEQAGLLYSGAFGAFNLFLLVIMEMVMFSLYQERIDDARRAQAERDAAEAAAPSA